MPLVMSAESEKVKVPNSIIQAVAQNIVGNIRNMEGALTRLLGKAYSAAFAGATRILYGAHDDLTAPKTISAFARRVGAELTVMPDGEHWFHTEEQMRFLDAWITEGAGR